MILIAIGFVSVCVFKNTFVYLCNSFDSLGGNRVDKCNLFLKFEKSNSFKNSSETVCLNYVEQKSYITKQVELRHLALAPAIRAPHSTRLHCGAAETNRPFVVNRLATQGGNYSANTSVVSHA